MIIDKMRVLDNLTMQEQTVVDYIIENPKSILELGVNDLAHASYTSASTIIRLCKKLGTKGYADLKFIYVQEYPEMMKLNESLKKVPYNQTATIDDIIHTMPLLYAKAINHTRSMIDRNTLIRVTNLIKQSQVVDIYGDGINYELAKMFCYKFEEIGISANAYNSIHWNRPKILEKENITSFAILLSHTGKNPSMTDAAKRLKECHIPTLAISGNIDHRLANLTNYHFYIMTTENTLEFSNVIFTTSIQYLLDVIVASSIVHRYKHIEDTLKDLKGARKAWLNDEK